MLTLQVMFILYTDVQVLQAHISWNQCTKLLIKFCNGKTIVIDGNVCGGGLSNENELILLSTAVLVILYKMCGLVYHCFLSKLTVWARSIQRPTSS